ncbi:HAD family hydrolase [Lysinibacillus irui]|uniref:HAD family hydrolase n=1 Tax=Lysinibacillus irui TaxID=2998077 RepID=A0AAJ5RKM2_9BACI|nr:HAD family hydrolase [Lysinibacillus irui]WDV07471.1 HAD family hydrolase [Lysinibacillus irui]
MKKVVVFDMDDTVYDEFDFVKSGFQAVAQYLASTYDLNEKNLYKWMWKEVLEKGRGTVFDNLLRELHLYNKTLVQKCISIYRLHKPNIKLPIESEKVLQNLSKDYVLYLVTDGNKIVQQNKVTALKIEQYMKKCYITYRYGRKHSKPSPHCFKLIAQRENIEPNQIVYIGDNPTKDFIGIKPLGFKTIRIMTGQHKDLELDNEYEADIRINSLLELPPILKQLWR